MPQTEFMFSYVKDNLDNSLICKSSPAGAGSPTGSLPFFIVYSQHPPLPPHLSISSKVPAVNSRVCDFIRICQDTRQILLQSTSSYKSQVDKSRILPPVFQLGHKVCLPSKYIHSKVPFLKFGSLGPYFVVCQINPIYYKLRLAPSLRTPNALQVSLLKH